MTIERSRTKRTINRTFRLEIEASRLLLQEAKDRNISANELINKLILKDLKAWRGLRGLNPILVPALTLKLLLEGLSDQKATEIGERVANDVLIKNVPFEVSGVLSPESVLEVMKLYHDVTETVHNGKKTVIMAHYAGRKYSLFVGTRFKTLFAHAGSKINFSVDDNAVIFEFNSRS